MMLMRPVVEAIALLPGTKEIQLRGWHGLAGGLTIALNPDHTCKKCSLVVLGF